MGDEDEVGDDKGEGADECESANNDEVEREGSHLCARGTARWRRRWWPYADRRTGS